MRYKFENFKIEIEPIEIIVDLNTIKDRAIDKIISVDITLVSPSGRFGLTADNVLMPYNGTWADEDIKPMAIEWLKQFEV